MRIGRMYLNGFGIHRDRQFDLDTSAPAALFIGRNEAGKSTVMGFIRTMLFGFPTRAHMPDRYEPAHGGIHGGFMTLLDARNREIRLERYEKNGSLKLTFADGSEAGETVLQSMLGGLTPEVFRNLFAFSLSELQKLDTLHSDEISGFLFSSGMGLSGSAIVQAERKLAGQMELLYKPKGTKQELNIGLKDIESSEAELRRSKEHSGLFNAWQEELHSLEERIRGKELDLESARSDREWYNKCRQAREAWIRLLEIDRELAGLPGVADMPADAIIRLEQLIADREGLLERMNLYRIKREETEQALGMHRCDEELIGRKGELDHLLESAVTYQDSLLRAVDLAKELEAGQAALNRHLRQIDANWTVEQVKRFPLSVGQREQIDDYAERFAAIGVRKAAGSSERERLSAARDRIEREAAADKEALQSLLDRKRERLSGAGEASLDIDAFETAVRRCWESVRRLAAEWSLAKRRLEDASRSESAFRGGREERSRPRVAVPIAVKAAALLTGAAAPLWLWLSADQPIAAAAVFLAFAALYLWMFLQTGHAADRKGGLDALLQDLSVRREAAEREADSLSRQFAEQTGELTKLLRGAGGWAEAAAGRLTPESSDPTETSRILEPVIEGLEKETARLRKLELEIEQARHRSDISERALADWRREWSERMEREQRLTADESEVKDAWTDWLRGYQLPDELVPVTVKLMCQYAEQALQAAEQIAKTDGKLLALRNMQAEYEEAAGRFLSQFDLSAPAVSTDLIFRLKRLKEQTEEHIRIRDKKLLLAQKAEELTAESQALAEALQRVEAKLSALFEEASALDDVHLRRNFRLFLHKNELIKEKLHLEVAVFTWVLPGQEDRLREALERLDADQIDDRLAESKRQAESIESELNELKDSRGRLRNEIERIRNGDAHAELLQLHQERIAGFEQSAAKWMQLALCAELIRKAREVYERERQPGVLQQASRYFAKITDGRYVRVVSRLGDKTIFVEKENGEQLDSAYLSRGTAEQLYLSMRFALADEYAKTVALPLFMDDIFVNFDRYRLEQTLSVLADVAERRQILLFTCHEHVAEAVQSALPRTQRIELHS